jgi:uncharacterized protein (DUF433 family)
MLATQGIYSTDMHRLKTAKYRKDVDSRELAIYTPADVARFIGVSESTLGTWIYGRWYPTAQGKKFFEPLIRAADPVNRLMSFYNLAEAHVLAATRYKHFVKLRNVRWAVQTIQERYPSPHPLISRDFFTDGRDIFTKTLIENENLTVPGKMNFKPIMDLFLEHIDRDEQGLVHRVFPIIKNQPEDKVIAIVHGVSSSEPIIAGSGVPVWVVYSRYSAGEQPESIADDFSVPLEKIRRAIDYVERKAA